MNRQAANDAQHADWNAGQINNSRNIQGFSNYLLDQSVIEVNNSTAMAPSATARSGTRPLMRWSSPILTTFRTWMFPITGREPTSGPEI